MVRTRSAPSPPPREAAPPSSPPSTRKRQRDSTDANPASSTSQSKATEGDSTESTDTRPSKKSKQEGETVAASEEQELSTSAPALGDSLKSTSNSSDTMTDSIIADHEEAEPTEKKEEGDLSPLDHLSAEERRKLKGKGKATEASPEENTSGDDLARMTRELAFKNSLIASQAALLSNFRSTVACGVCLETLDKPYALACGHVFCRKCLLEWFFRPDPTAERENETPDSSSNSESGSSSSSSSTSSSSSSSSSESEESSRSRSRSRSRSHSQAPSNEGSTASSYVGGSFRGQDFRVRNSGTGRGGAGAGGMAATFGAISDRIYQAAFGSSSSARRQTPAIGGGGGGGTETSTGSRDVPRITEAESDSGEEEAEDEGEEKESQAKEADPEEMRKARLARFASIAAEPKVGIPPRGAEAESAAEPEQETLPHDPLRRPTPPRFPPPSRDPPPYRPPPALPKGEHRSKNLVCPQCRTPCSERSPHRIFVLSELLSLVRTAEESGMFQRSSTTPAPLHATESGGARTNLPGLDESDGSWGGLFPGVGGTESVKDRRRRMATVVRDRDDGVRRCGDCAWEIDRSGICEGCGREWNLSSDGEAISEEDSEDDVGMRFRFGRYDRLQRALARRHHAVDDSERSDDSDDDSDRRGRDGEEDDYESDGFLVRSGEEDNAVGGRGRRPTLHFEEAIWSDDSDSEAERERERRAARRRRERRREGEVIDPDSDTPDEEDESGDSSSGLQIGSHSEEEEEDDYPAAPRRRIDSDSPPPVPYRPRRQEHSDPSSSLSSSGTEEEEVAPIRRKRRVIADDESE